jgi:imidazolonepropionase-like amidohydrolase
VPWKNQVLEESRAERVARAVNHLDATLRAGFTTVRDLGTEGAAFDDVGIKSAIEKGIIQGPRMLVATEAIVATGSYAPKSGSADIDFPKGAAEADGVEGLTKEIRRQMGKGADVIKLYGDYRWGLNGEAQPSFTQAELNAAVEVAASAGRKVVVHAVTTEAMKRAAMAGVSTIEHGDLGDEATFTLMREKGVAFCPTLAATESVTKYRGWQKGAGLQPEGITYKKKSFAAALKSGVTILMGGDVGVFAHGNNAIEMELMVEYGMPAKEVLRSATSVNADVFGIADKVGRIKSGLLADLLVVDGNPAENINHIRRVEKVMKDGEWIVR